MLEVHSALGFTAQGEGRCYAFRRYAMRRNRLSRNLVFNPAWKERIQEEDSVFVAIQDIS